jgi:hypothetical protein
VCAGRALIASAWGNTAADVLAGKVRILGSTAQVDLDDLDLRTPPPAFADASRAMWWRSMIWATPVFAAPTSPSYTVPAAEAAALIDDLVRGLDANPDPGTTGTSAQAQAAATAAGWDEGTNLRRNEVLNCLAPSSGMDPRVVAHLRAAIAANKDPFRYYGPPYHRVHNHGTMANLALLDSASILSDRALATFALARLGAEMRDVFSPGGFSYEQSTAYHDFNRSLWHGVVGRLPAAPGGASSAALRTLLAAADAMTSFLTDPRGVEVPLGDGWVSAPTGPPARHPAAVGTTDVRGGVAAWRWSWSDRRTTYYTVRFGPPRRGHGHDDATAVTWGTLGVPVLVDPGDYTADRSLALEAWQSSPQAHNLAMPAGARIVGGASPLLSRTRTGSVDVLRVRSGLFSVPVTRTLRVDDHRHSATVTDAGSGTLTEHFHLDPSWRPSVRRYTRSTVTWWFSNGHQRLALILPRSGVTVVVRRGGTAPLAGWVFPAFEVSVPALEVLVVGRASVSSTWVVVAR